MKTLIINLKSREDRRQEILQEVAKIPFLDYEIVDAIEHKNTKIGCTLSHKLCIEIAKQRKLPYVLILEDDAVFEDNALEVLERSWKEVQAYDWKVFYLGANLRDTSYGITPDLIEVRRPNTNHAYIVHESFYDTMLGLTPDIIIDLQMRALSYTDKMYMCAPMIAFQRKSYSDLEKKIVDYKPDMLANYKLHVKWE